MMRSGRRRSPECDDGGGVRPGGGAADDGCLKSRHRAAVRNSRRGTIAVLRDLSVGDILL